MTGLIDKIIQKIADFTGGDVVALILLLAAIGFAISMVRTAFKFVGIAVAFLAVLYLVNPSIYSVALSLVGKFWEGLCELARSLGLSELLALFRKGS